MKKQKGGMKQQTRAVIAVTITALAFGGCAAKDARQIDVTPGAPGMAGQYDFDILDDVSGKGCSSTVLWFHAGSSYSAAGSRFTSAGDSFFTPITDEANAAAAYDALTKVAGADVILITRSKTDGFRVPGIFANYCTELRGKAVRLKKVEAVGNKN